MTAITSETMRGNADFRKVSPDYQAIKDIADDLGGEVFGQPEACNQLARAITRSMAGFSDPRRPEMTAMFLGPTGVGKTEMSKALAKYLYQDKWEKKFLRIDCTQLQDGPSIGRLKGADPNYIGYGDSNMLITPEFLEEGGVIVFDEIEKAHSSIWKWLLPVMEEGQQTTMASVQGPKGWSSELTTLDFANTYLIFTSNVGAEQMHKARTGNRGLGFRPSGSQIDIDSIGKTELKKAFQGMPEFLGRIDATVVFNELERPEFEKIFNKFLDEINEDQRYGQNYLAVTRELRNYIIDRAVGKGEYGAREIRHAINQHLLDKASEIKYSGVLHEGVALIGDIEEGEVIFWTNDVILEDERKDREGPLVTAPIPQPELKLISGGKKKEEFERDPGSFIGNRPDDHIPSEQDTGEEDIRPDGEVIDLGEMSIFIAPKKPTGSIDIGIVIKEEGKIKRAAITGVPIFETED